jgi:hypothetical protein
MTNTLGISTRPPFTTRSLHRARLVALAMAGFLAVWCVVLGIVLPPTSAAGHWSLAWAGLDAAEAAAALATAILITRSTTYASFTAIAAGTLLLIDAWFDIGTAAPGLDSAIAVAEAVIGEIPLAIGAVWLALALTLQRGNRGDAARSAADGDALVPDAVLVSVGADRGSEQLRAAPPIFEPSDKLYHDSRDGWHGARVGSVPRQRCEASERQSPSMS